MHVDGFALIFCAGALEREGDAGLVKMRVKPSDRPNVPI
jgi:hypothetical protein